MIMSGDGVFQYFRIQPPSFYNTIKNHKMITGLAVFIVGNYLKGQIASTGAFEVLINNQLVFNIL